MGFWATNPADIWGNGMDEKEEDDGEISSDEIYSEIAEMRTQEMRSLFNVRTAKPPSEEKQSTLATIAKHPTSVYESHVDIAEDFSVPTEADYPIRPKFRFSWETVASKLDPIPKLPQGLAAYLEGETRTDQPFRPRSFRRYSHNRQETMLPFNFEEALTMTDIYRLHQGFLKHAESGINRISRSTFMNMVMYIMRKKFMTEESVLEFFTHIDVYERGEISWFDVINYLQMEYGTVLKSQEKFHGVVGFKLPALCLKLDFQSKCRIVGVSQIAEDIIVMFSDSGSIVQWSLKENELMTILRIPTEHARIPSVLDMVYLPLEEKLFFSNDNYEIIVYDAKMLNFICKISNLSSVPFKLDCCSWRRGECLLLYGDEIGCVNAIIIPDLNSVLPSQRGLVNLAAQTLRLPELVANQKAKYIRWHVHGHSVNEIRYFPALKALGSCSNDPNTAVVIGSVEGFKRIGHFHIPLNVQSLVHISPLYVKAGIPRRSSSDEYALVVPRGVISFDCSENSHLVATGGTDKVLRIWCLEFRTRPLEELHAHLKPIVLVRFHEKMQNFLLTVSKDRCICIWSSQVFRLLYTLPSSGYVMDFNDQLIESYFSPVSEKLYMLSNSLYVLSMKKQRVFIKSAAGHSNIVLALVVRVINMTLISACQNGEILEWDICSGKLLGAFEHEKEKERTAVTKLVIDSSKQFLLSSHDDGKICVWSLRNHKCLKILQTDKFARITSLLCKDFDAKQWIIAAGWDRKIHFFVELEIGNTDKQKPRYSIQDNSLKPLEGIIHQPFIQSMAAGPGNKLATSSDDGEIHIWNIQMFTMNLCMTAPQPTDFSQEVYVEADMQIRQVCFLKKRKLHERLGGQCLVALGPFDMIHFWWCEYPNGRLVAQFIPTDVKKAVGRCFVLSENENLLITADTKGYIHIFQIKEYGMKNEAVPPPLERSWKAHEHTITNVEVVAGEDLLITSSADFSIRLWTFSGTLFGIFGQLKTWDINLYGVSETEISEGIAESKEFLTVKMPSKRELKEDLSTSMIFSPKDEEMLSRSREALSSDFLLLRPKKPKLSVPVESEVKITYPLPSKDALQRVRKQIMKSYVNEKISSGTWACLMCPNIQDVVIAPAVEKPKNEPRLPLRKSARHSVVKRENEEWKQVFPLAKPKE